MSLCNWKLVAMILIQLNADHDTLNARVRMFSYKLHMVKGSFFLARPIVSHLVEEKMLDMLSSHVLHSTKATQQQKSCTQLHFQCIIVTSWQAVFRLREEDG